MYQNLKNLFITAAIFTLFCSQVYSQESVRELKQAIANVKKEIAEQEAKTQAESKRDLEYQKTAQSRLSRLKTQISRVSKQKDSLKVELTQLKGASKKLKGASYWYSKKREKFAAYLAIETDSLITELNKRYPYELESKVEVLQGISTRLKSDNIQPEEALDRIWSVLLEYVKGGYEVETWKGTLDQDSGPLQGEFLRMGFVFQIFAVDQSDAMYTLQAKDGEWKWTLREFTLDERNKIHQAFKVKQGKSNPELVELPLPVQNIPVENEEVVP